jgi:hypothetical protein
MMTPLLEDPDEEFCGRVTCAVCVGAEKTAVVRSVVAEALYQN